MVRARVLSRPPQRARGASIGDPGNRGGRNVVLCDITVTYLRTSTVLQSSSTRSHGGVIFSLSMSIAETFAQSHTRHIIIPSRLHADTEHVRTLPLKEGNREVCSVNSIRQQSACNKRDLGNSRDHPFPSPRPRRQRSRHSNAQLAEPPTPLPAPRPAPTRLARLGDAPSAHTAHPFAARGPSPIRTLVSPQSAPAR